MTRASGFSHRAVTACWAAPRYDTRAPWWDSLPLDFASSPEPFSLTPLERARVGLTAAADVVLRTLGATLVGSIALPLGYNPVGIYRSLRDQEHYVKLALAEDAGSAFQRPPAHVPMLRRAARTPLFSPDDGACEDVRFESPFVPGNPHESSRYLRLSRNRFAHARHWRHDKPARAAILAIHGFSADLYHFNEWFFSLPWLYKRGFDIVLVTMPFHGKRQTTFSPFSGHGFFAGGTNRINEALAQAVFDMRILMDSLFEMGIRQIGVTGMSLGGLATSLLACADERLAFAIPNVPVVSVADLVLEWEPIATVIRTSLGAIGKDVRTARRMLATSSPLSFRPKLPKERLFIIGGVGDRLAPPRHARLLWDHWDRPRMHWFPGSHVLHLDRREYFRSMRRFFTELGFEP
ncbi:MAG: alpha/beta hydrolase family protein [Polyangiaceae bacterium]|nr:alpha/beta hydrolase family protein [Polyangiaceae bacterium]